PAVVSPNSEDGPTSAILLEREIDESVIAIQFTLAVTSASCTDAGASINSSGSSSRRVVSAARMFEGYTQTSAVPSNLASHVNRTRKRVSARTTGNPIVA